MKNIPIFQACLLEEYERLVNNVVSMTCQNSKYISANNFIVHLLLHFLKYSIKVLINNLSQSLVTRCSRTPNLISHQEAKALNIQRETKLQSSSCALFHCFIIPSENLGEKQNCQLLSYPSVQVNGHWLWDLRRGNSERYFSSNVPKYMLGNT